MQKFNYSNLGYWFLLLIIFTFGGFYFTYFTQLSAPIKAIIHIHFLLMSLWIMMLIAQPFLIKYKRLSTHRFLGKVSYLLVPLVILTAWLVTRNEYYRNIVNLQNEVSTGLQNLSQFEILKAAAVYPSGLISIFWFVIFYGLAIKYRKQTFKHARYILATALILLYPTIDRIIGINLGISRMVAGIQSSFITFLIINLILSVLLFFDYRNNKEIKTLSTCLIIFVIGQLCFYILPNFNLWAEFVRIIMLPKP